MKIISTKTISFVVLAGMFTMLSSFCLMQILFSSTHVVNAAQAATVEHNMVNNDNSCEQELAVMPDAEQSILPITNNNQNSLLPCCIDGNHNGAAGIFQSGESIHLLPTFIFSRERALVVDIPKIVVYFNPIIPPPELVSIKTITLRI